MKLHKIFYYIGLNIIPFLGNSAFADQPKGIQDQAVKVLYVSSMKVNLDNGEVYSKILTNTIRAELGKSSRYKLANPETDQSVELAKNYNETCLSVEECARKEAKAVDADLVLISDVEQIEKQCRITMRLEDIYSKEIIKTKNLRASCAINDMEAKSIELVYLIMRNEVSGGTGTRAARITSDPPGAKVTINNEEIGYTPLERKIPTGQVKILLEIEGTDRYAPILVNELVEDSQQLFIYNKIFAERNAYLVFDINPPSSKILVDNKKIDNNFVKKIPVEIKRDHVVVISAPKHESKTLNIPSLEPDQEYKLSINLMPSPCSLKLSSNPSGSEVLKNGIRVGSTPYVEEVVPGEHNYSIQKQFYQPLDVSFFCAPEEVVQRAVNLQRAKYSEEDQVRINEADRLRKASYFGFGLSAGLATFSYLKNSEFKKLDGQYMAATNPFEIESIKAKRTIAKNLSTTFAIGSVASIGISYLFYTLGNFPEDLKQKNNISIIPAFKGAEVAWQFSW